MNASLIAGVRARDPRAVARALSLVADRDARASGLLRALRTGARRAYVVGITGPPGGGKSTIVHRLVTKYRAAGSAVAVLAADPSSAVSGGAILGDRIRMQAHANDPGVFIRSVGTRGDAGGIPGTVGDAVLVLESAGFDIVLVETVGVGQDQVEIARLADVVVVVLTPGTGDDIQALKAGVMEIGDIFVVNKADLAGADEAVSAVEGMLSLGAARAEGWTPPVLRMIATQDEGVTDLVGVLARVRAARGTPRPDATVSDPGAAARAVELDHVAFAVAGAAGAADFFETVLGLRALPAERVEDQQVFVQFLDGGPAALERVWPAAPASPVSAFLERRGPGLHHVAFRVENLSAVLARLAARGVRLIDATPRRGAHGRWIAFVHPASTGGVLVELVEKESRADR